MHLFSTPRMHEFSRTHMVVTLFTKKYFPPKETRFYDKLKHFKTFLRVLRRKGFCVFFLSSEDIMRVKLKGMIVGFSIFSGTKKQL